MTGHRDCGRSWDESRHESHQRKSRMVEISSSGSGEGPGWATSRPTLQELLLPFSCKRRGFCPSCAARRMAPTAPHLVECVMPWVPNMSVSLGQPRSRLRVEPLFQVVTDLPRAVHTLRNGLGE